MSTAIERLRASKAEHEACLRLAGHLAGKEWAENTAEYGELLALSKVDTEIYGGNPANVDEWIAEVLDPDDEIGPKDLLKHLFGTKQWPEPEWLVGWIEGAQELFEGVKDEI